MKQSQLATKVRKEVSEDESAKNAELLIRAGYISKSLAGVYSFLPLGLRSVTKVMDIIREEMNAIGGQEVFLASLQRKDVWESTERWGGDAEEVWFKSALQVGGEIGFGWTHEEPITELMKQHVHSYRDLPVYLYQLQTKFRNEKRAKSGIMRTREFIMKDLYSFSKNEEEHAAFYERCAEAYMRIFNRCGLGEQTFRTFASGGAFAEFSDEFQTIVPVGEDTIYLDRERGIALNKEVYRDDVIEKLGLDKGKLEEVAASEVGNIFTLGTRFSDALGLMYTAEDGSQQPVFMGSYGIGPARVLGVAVELLSNESSIVLPASIAPYTVHVIHVGTDGAAREAAETLHRELEAAGVDTLLDDRDMQAGEKFAEADLIGIPHRIVVSERSMGAGGVEYTNRLTGSQEIVTPGSVTGMSFV